MSLQMRQNMNVRMEQRLKLTPQMIQSIEILLLPQMALEERIMHEVESNPTLEIDDAATAPERSDDDRAMGEAAAERDATDEWLWQRKARHADDDGPDKMEALASAPDKAASLADHLVDQLRFVEMSADVRALAHDICCQLDRRGYLPVPLLELFPEEKLEHAEQAWEHVRRCDPAGVGARDLRNRLPAVAQALNVEVDRVKEGLDVIAKLDPKPGLPYGVSDNMFVVPDVTVERDERDDEWIVSIPDDRLPKVRVSESYYQLYERKDVDPKEKAYLKEKLGAARFIIDAVAQRKRTLLKIVSEIIKHQTAFLEHGVEHLRPLMRQNIADVIGMHVATVSRAVKDKYIQTPGGIIPLSSFFSGGIATQDGSEAESSKSVKLKIHKLIHAEDKKNPLSDQELADILAKDGLDISRRTVTKYRIADGIPSTRQRRSF